MSPSRTPVRFGPYKFKPPFELESHASVFFFVFLFGIPKKKTYLGFGSYLSTKPNIHSGWLEKQVVGLKNALAGVTPKIYEYPKAGLLMGMVFMGTGVPLLGVFKDSPNFQELLLLVSGRVTTKSRRPSQVTT